MLLVLRVFPANFDNCIGTEHHITKTNTIIFPFFVKFYFRAIVLCFDLFCNLLLVLLETQVIIAIKCLYFIICFGFFFCLLVLGKLCIFYFYLRKKLAFYYAFAPLHIHRNQKSGSFSSSSNIPLLHSEICVLNMERNALHSIIFSYHLWLFMNLTFKISSYH